MSDIDLELQCTEAVHRKDDYDSKTENSGGDVNYYLCPVDRPKRKEFAPYIAEAEDIIEALDMTFAEGTVLKSLWRSCAERTLGLKKEGGDGIRDAEKMVYSSERVLVTRKRKLK